MSEKPNFTGEYAYGTRAATSPNPCITLEGSGFLGLPLSARDAAFISGIAEQAPLGKGKRPSVKSRQQHSKTVLASKIKFANSSWGGFIDASAKSACARLGATVNPETFKCELDRMVMHDSSSK